MHRNCIHSLSQILNFSHKLDLILLSHLYLMLIHVFMVNASSHDVARVHVRYSALSVPYRPKCTHQIVTEEIKDQMCDTR